MTDAANRRSTDATHALRQDIYYLENLVGLLIEEEMVVPKVGAGEVPVEILRFHVERESVRYQRIQRCGDSLHRFWRQICRRRELFRRGIHLYLNIGDRKSV